jgi:hypothetical protein
MTTTMRLALDDAERLINTRHAETNKMWDCHDGDNAPAWRACHTYTLARIRGICHTLYVVCTPAMSQTFAVLDWCNDGPVDALHATLVDGFTDYSDALMFAASIVSAENIANRIDFR